MASIIRTVIPTTTHHKPINTSTIISQILNNLAQSDMTEADITIAYQSIFGDNSPLADNSSIFTMYSRGQIYAAFLIEEFIKKIVEENSDISEQDTCDKLGRLCMNITKYCPELTITEEFINQATIYLDEISDENMNLIIEKNGTVYNLNVCRGHIVTSEVRHQLYNLQHELEQLTASPENIKNNLKKACSSFEIISSISTNYSTIIKNSINCIISSWIGIFNQYIVNIAFNQEIITVIHDILISINRLLNYQAITINNNQSLFELLSIINSKLEIYLSSSNEFNTNELISISSLFIIFNTIATFNCQQVIHNPYANVSFKDKMTITQTEQQRVIQQASIQPLNQLITQFYNGFHNAELTDKLYLCINLVKVIATYDKKHDIPITNYLEEMIIYITDNLDTRVPHSVKRILFEPNIAKFISNDAIIAIFYWLQNIFITPNTKRQIDKWMLLCDITKYAKTYGVYRNLFLPIELPKLSIELAHYDNTGKAFHVHNTMYHLPYLRKMLEELLNHFHVPPFFDDYFYFPDKLYNYLLKLIKRLYNPLQQKNIKAAKEIKLNYDAIILILNIMHSNINIQPICKQFFVDLGYLITFLLDKNVRWTNVYANSDDRMRIFFLAFVDSANAYDKTTIQSNTISCLTGIYERIYYAFSTLITSCTIVNEVAFLNMNSMQLYSELQQLLNNPDFTKQVATTFILNNNIFDLKIIGITIVNMVIEINEKIVSNKLNEYSQRYNGDDLPPYILNKHVNSLWQKMLPSLKERLNKIVYEMVEEYKEEPSNQFGIEAIQDKIIEISGDETKS